MTVLTLVGCGQIIKLQIKQNCFGLWLYFNETSAQRFLLKLQLNWLIFYEATATISIYAYIFEEGNDIFCGFIHLQYEKKWFITLFLIPPQIQLKIHFISILKQNLVSFLKLRFVFCNLLWIKALESQFVLFNQLSSNPARRWSRRCIYMVVFFMLMIWPTFFLRVSQLILQASANSELFSIIDPHILWYFAFRLF